VTVVGQAAGVLVSAAVYVAGLVMVVLGRRAWIAGLPADDREAWPEIPVARTVVATLRQFGMRPYATALAELVLIVVVLFALEVSIWVELLFIAGATVVFPAPMAGSVTRAGRIGDHVMHLGYWGGVCFLAGLVVAIVR
jgi:hypothetical protein